MSGTSAEDLFTQEQRDYVADVKDCDLRAELLHQLRLRDLLRQDRDLYERRCIMLETRVSDLNLRLDELENR